ncbi:rhodanese domain-containing protein CG4456 isoform X1 [Andrena cerasifolii]|uniref:rhodanese domain-containing protein CG4456 isoform X1 n=2 Tax=Andrena cerasifolii TaxID=2819439 RepID=UPI004038048C
MSTVCKLIITCGKAQQFSKTITPLRTFHCTQCTVRKAFIYDKLLKNAPYRIFPLQAESTLRLSTSTFLNTDCNTMCEGDKKALNVYYKDILEAQKDDSVFIIDVREESEIDETGKLPGSIHIPMGTVAAALTNLSEADFKAIFDKEKPLKNTKIILSCRSGTRSAMVQDEIQKLGYNNVYNYVGGWLDWESNQ